MDIEATLTDAIAKGFESCFNHTLELSEVNIQPTKKDFEGDFTFVTFPYGRYSKRKPEETAQMLGDYLTEHTEIVKDCNVVKGFLNIQIDDQAWTRALHAIVNDPHYGMAVKKDEEVVIEYSSPNTNKPLHLGHLRNNFLGYSVSRILEAAGYKVDKVNLVNDRGIHICKSMLAYRKFGDNETPASSGIKGDHLIGKYYVKFDEVYKKEIDILVASGKTEEEAAKQAPILLEAQEMLKKWEDGDPDVVSLWSTMNGWVYEGFEATYRRMGVKFDKYYYESDTYILGKDIVEEGLQKGVFYKKDNGSVWIDLTPDGLDEKLLLRADGTSVYMTQDLGTADLKYTNYKFDKSIYVVGNEQDYHFQVLFLILKKLGRSYANGMYHLSYGMVDLPSGKMKSREGTVVDADDLMDEMAATAKRHTEELGKIEGFTEDQANELYETLALGAVKYFLLKVDPKKRMMFDPEQSIQFHGNTGPFIQYTHARIAAILRKANQLGINYLDFQQGNIEELHEAEKAVLLLLVKFPKVIEEAAHEFSPATIAQYVYDLAKEYNRFYTEISIFGAEEDALLQFRVAFSFAVAYTIKISMGMLGIEVPDRM